MRHQRDITTEGLGQEGLGRPEAARAKQEADFAEAVARRAAEQARLEAGEEAAVATRRCCCSGTTVTGRENLFPSRERTPTPAR